MGDSWYLITKGLLECHRLHRHKNVKMMIMAIILNFNFLVTSLGPDRMSSTVQEKRTSQGGWGDFYCQLLSCSPPSDDYGNSTTCRYVQECCRKYLATVQVLYTDVTKLADGRERINIVNMI